MSVLCSLVITCLERDYLLASLLSGVFLCFAELAYIGVVHVLGYINYIKESQGSTRFEKDDKGWF